MIPTRWEDLTEKDFTDLITNGVAEGRTIEYKRDLTVSSDAERKEFLADISSFANTSGGDLIFGIDEQQGLPIKISGLQIADPDLEIQRVESIAAAGISPRIRFTLKFIPLQSGRKLLIIRVERSWSGPHRVIFSGHDRFYGRNAAGKYSLDVNELRAAFTLSSGVTERIRAFRTDRLIELSNNQTPVPFVPEPKIVLHCIPIESFASQSKYNLEPLYNPLRFKPIGTDHWDRRWNLEGLISFGTAKPSFSYSQMYRNGVVEVVYRLPLTGLADGSRLIPSIAYERDIFAYLPFCIQVLRTIGVSAPVVVALAFTNTRGLRMAVDSQGFDLGYSIEQDTLIIPETLVEDLSTPVGKILKPMFDIVWNACGYPSSKNFDPEGNWIDRR